MKKRYISPSLEMVPFEVEEAVASCEYKITFGPEESCADFGFEEESAIYQRRARGIPCNPFYDAASCECYVTAPADFGYFSS